MLRALSFQCSRSRPSETRSQPRNYRRAGECRFSPGTSPSKSKRSRRIKEILDMYEKHRASRIAQKYCFISFLLFLKLLALPTIAAAQNSPSLHRGPPELTISMKIEKYWEHAWDYIPFD